MNNRAAYRATKFSPKMEIGFGAPFATVSCTVVSCSRLINLRSPRKQMRGGNKMLRKCIVAFGVAAIAGATLLLSPATSLAQRSGGGRRGGGDFQGRNNRDWGRGDDFRRIGGWSWGWGVGYPYYGWGYGQPYYGRYYAPSYSGDNVIYSSSAYAPAADDRAHVTIRVPSDHADVWIEGQHSVQDRSAENYASPPLTAGQRYYYEIRARWTDSNGRTMDQTRTFSIAAGSAVLVDFSRPAPADQTVTSSSGG
jgi:uncharacterized protein (TIGR03000 family)